MFLRLPPRPRALGDDPLPPVGPVPWESQKVDRWQQAATILGVVGGALGLLVSIRALGLHRRR